MYYEIYIDSIFLINFVMNLCLFFLVSKTLDRTATRIRLVAGSAVGALLFCIILIIPGITYFWKVLIGLIPVNMMTIAFTFKIKKLKQLINLTLWLYAYAFFFGGLILFLQKRIPMLRENAGTVWGTMGCICAAAMLGDYLIKKMDQKKQNSYYQVHIPCQGTVITVRALADTGNSLQDPVTGKPVSILDQKIWEQLSGLKKEDKYKIIPFHSVGVDHGIMEGYELDHIIVEGMAGQTVCRDAIVAICSDRVSSDGEYQMILHPKLLRQNVKFRRI